MPNGDLRTDGIHSFFLGRHIIRNGDRPQRISRSFDPMSQFYNLNKTIFNSCNIDVDKNVTMNGCFKSNKITLQRTMIPDIKCDLSGLPSMSKIKLFKNSIRSAIRKLKITRLAKCNKEDMLLTSYNPKSFAGFSYKQYYNLENKEEASEVAMKVAMKRWDNISRAFISKKKIKRNNLYPNTFVVGARNKRDFDYIDGDVISSRAVHMPEFHTELNSLPWMEQISNHIKFKQKGPIYIGNSFVKYDRLYKDTNEYNNILEGDWKRFDSRLYITNIIIGLSILRLYYDFDDIEIDYHFIAIFDTIGIKDYYTPGGYLYRLVHGLPSGVCSTSLLGSIINFVNLLYVTEDIPSKRVKFIVGGDDFLIAIDNNMYSDDIIDRIKNRADSIGQVFKFLECKSFKNKNILNRPCFFKYTIDRDEPVVYPSALLERTFIPWNKKYDNNIKVLLFLNDLIPSLGSPRSFHLPFYYFYVSISSKVFERDVGINEIFFLHKNIYRRIMSGERFYKQNSQIYYKNFSIHLNASLISSKDDKGHFFLRKNRKFIRLKIQK